MIWTLAFWKGLGERALKTFLQALLAAMVASGVTFGVSGFQSVSWLTVLSIAGLATLGSIITSVFSANFVAGSNPVIDASSAPAPASTQHADATSAVDAELARRGLTTNPSLTTSPSTLPAFGGAVPASAPASTVAASPVGDAEATP